jgi:hypothetical protein
MDTTNGGTLSGVTGGMDWGSFFSGAGGLVDRYLAYRLTKSGDAKGDDGKPQQIVIAGQAMPAWVGPVAVLGGIGLIAYLVLKR